MIKGFSAFLLVGVVLGFNCDSTEDKSPILLVEVVASGPESIKQADVSQLSFETWIDGRLFEENLKLQNRTYLICEGRKDRSLVIKWKDERGEKGVSFVKGQESIDPKFSERHKVATTVVKLLRANQRDTIREKYDSKWVSNTVAVDISVLVTAGKVVEAAWAFLEYLEFARQYCSDIVRNELQALRVVFEENEAFRTALTSVAEKVVNVYDGQPEFAPPGSEVERKFIQLVMDESTPLFWKNAAISKLTGEALINKEFMEYVVQGVKDGSPSKFQHMKLLARSSDKELHSVVRAEIASPDFGQASVAILASVISNSAVFSKPVYERALKSDGLESIDIARMLSFANTKDSLEYAFTLYQSQTDPFAKADLGLDLLKKTNLPKKQKFDIETNLKNRIKYWQSGLNFESFLSGEWQVDLPQNPNLGLGVNPKLDISNPPIKPSGSLKPK